MINNIFKDPILLKCLQKIAVIVIDGCTPLKKSLYFPVLKAQAKYRPFQSVYNDQHKSNIVFLKDYIHMHQMGSRFVGSYRLDFSPTEQED